MYLSRLCVFLTFVFYSPELVKAQLVVNNTVNAAAGVQSFLLGDGVTISNLTFSGENDQFASFTCTSCGLNIASGFVMSTGNASGAIGPNNLDDYQSIPDDSDNAGDADLEELSAQDTHNAAIVEFDFEAVGTSVAFNFVFGSEEYLEYVGSINDVFGFFLSGPGIVGGFADNAINIALVPGSNNPISINNINENQNSQYFQNNELDAFNVQADGFTTVMTAGYTGLVCGETYHIKLALADASDGWLDSWVFFESGSFVSEATTTSITSAVIAPGQGAIYEGCAGAEIQISRAGSALAETFNLSYGGSASIQLDFELLTTVVQFAPGETTASLPITALQDGLTEGVEIVVITVSGNSCGTVFNDEYTLEIHDAPPVSVSLTDVILNCGETSTLLDLAPSGGIAPLTVTWEDGAVGNTLIWPVSGPDEVSYAISDACGNDTYTGSVNIVVSTPDPLTISAGPDVTGDCTEAATVIPVVSGGFGDYTFEWSFQNTVFSSDQQVVLPFNAPGTFVVTVNDDCGNSASDQLVVSQESYTIQADLGPDLSVTCLDQLSLNVAIVGARGAVQYAWSDAGGSLGNEPQLNYSTTMSSTVTVVITDACGASAEDALVLQVPLTTIALDLPGTIIVPCDGTTQVTANPGGGQGSYSYSWTLDGDVISNSASCDIPSVNGGEVALTATDICNNSGQAFTEIVVPPIPMQVDAGLNATTDCLTPVTISPVVTGGNGTYFFEWFANGSIVTTSPDLLSFFDADTEIVVQVTDGCGNEAGDVVLVFVPSVPLAVSAGNDIVATCTEINQLQAGAQGGVGMLSYEWLAGDVLLANGNAFSIIASQDTLLTVIARDECGHQAFDEIQLSIPPVPIVIDLPTDTLLCAGSEVIIPARARGGVGELDYSWNMATASADTLTLVLQSLTSVNLTVADVCGNQAQHTLLIQPEVVDASFSFEYTGDMSAAFTNTSTGGISYVWMFGDGESSEDTSPEHSFGTVDEWLVQLFAFSPLGCIATAEATLVPAGEVFIPSAFTPDFDGLNDVFKAEGHDLKRFELSIYNRWGEVIFRSSDLTEAWDGSHLLGDYSVPDNQYIYRYEAEDRRGRVWENTGSISILR
jgi:gliding motility-associated-like protein